MSNPSFVFPGTLIDISFLGNPQNSDDNAQSNEENETVVTLGPGLIEFDGEVRSFVAGRLLDNSKDSIWVDYNKKRYVPSEGEPVIGTVIARHAEGYRIDIGSAQPANLDSLAFENATKRNKPNIAIGSLVYGKVTLANRDIEPEIECYNSNTGKSEGFGELQEGFVMKTSLRHCRTLLKHNPHILVLLGEHLSFEIAVGLNGFVWIKSPSYEHTILISNAIKNSEYLSDSDSKLMVNQLVAAL
ncbi:Exosome complex component rrp40 [Smittium mucronatum]|uniref:Ribosomal RNA-processing protein 40 n=1 Tax=Smittium mucronatum TaxID=133383 RepID=A0A1R0GZR6_9FUNG|nr:Exosome complex component rrp40 [Smittium mucronatum]